MEYFFKIKSNRYRASKSVQILCRTRIPPGNVSSRCSRNPRTSMAEQKETAQLAVSVLQSRPDQETTIDRMFLLPPPRRRRERTMNRRRLRRRPPTIRPSAPVPVVPLRQRRLPPPPTSADQSKSSPSAAQVSALCRC